MVAYTPTPADLEAAVGLKEEEKETVVVVERRSYTAWMWKVSAGLLVAALCLGLVLLFAWYWHGGAESTVRRGLSNTKRRIEEKKEKKEKSFLMLPAPI